MSVLGDDGGLIETIHFARSGDGARSLTDYFAKEDLAIFQAVTVGEKINKALSEMDEKEEYSRIFYLHGLSVHLAEALAAYVHDRIRRELGLKTGQGKRYSPGYPLWRNIEDQRKVFKILKAEERIGISLTEACQIVPEQSTTAMVVHSDRAEY